ncbi:MAG: hypothetical protein NZ534_11010, partial [Bacteroidia bacterium]|nr:hypothetical protein [Bacteroidia bacterium]
IVYPAPGLYNVRLTVCNADTCYSNLQTGFISIVEYAPLTLPFVEDFEGPEHWTTENPDGTTTWEIELAVGNNGPTRAAMIELYDYFDVGQRDRLVSPPLNFSNVGPPITLEFDYAYCRMPMSFGTDSLIVLVARGCGQNRTRVRAFGDNGNDNFATYPPHDDYFIPDAGDWCYGTFTPAECPTIDLSDFAGEAAVQIVFESYNNYLNNLWLDNIRIRGQMAPSCPWTANFTVNELTVCPNADLTVEYVGNAPSNAVFSWNFDGGQIVSGQGAGPYVVRWSTPGNKTLRLVVSDDSCASQPYVQTVRVRDVSANFELMNATVCSGVPQTVALSDSPVPGAQYFWSFGGAEVVSGSGSGPYQIVWNDGGTKTVALDVIQGNCSARQERTVAVVHIPKPEISVPAPHVLAGDNLSVEAISSEADVQYIWDFDGATAVPGGTASPRQTLTWNVPGTKNVSLRLFKTGCYSQADTVVVSVNSLTRAERSSPVMRFYPQPARDWLTVEC